jgi:hypothetical protein
MVFGAIDKSSMMYQRSDKEMVAAYLGVDVARVDVACDKWMKIRGAYLDRANDWARAVKFNMTEDMPVRKATREADRKFFARFNRA